MNAFDAMIRACLNDLYIAERDQISVQLLCRIVQICADTVAEPDDEDAFPALQFIKAWTVRERDVIWRPELTRFAIVTQTDSELAVDLMYVEFDLGEPACYGRDDVVEIPVHRAHAYEWTARRRTDASGATPATDS